MTPRRIVPRNQFAIRPVQSDAQDMSDPGLMQRRELTISHIYSVAPFIVGLAQRLPQRRRDALKTLSQPVIKDSGREERTADIDEAQPFEVL